MVRRDARLTKSGCGVRAGEARARHPVGPPPGGRRCASGSAAGGPEEQPGPGCTDGPTPVTPCLGLGQAGRDRTGHRATTRSRLRPDGGGNSHYVPSGKPLPLTSQEDGFHGARFCRQKDALGRAGLPEHPAQGLPQKTVPVTNVVLPGAQAPGAYVQTP